MPADLDGESAWSLGRTLCSLSDEDALMVLAESPHRFYSTQAGADIEFDLPETGPATGLTLYQGGQELPAPRLEDEPESK